MASAEQARRLGRRFIMLDNILVVFGFFCVFPLISLHFVDQLGWAAMAASALVVSRDAGRKGRGGHAVILRRGGSSKIIKV